MVDELNLRGLAVAFGVGLLIGIEREKSKGSGPGRGPAGVRTFTLASLMGALGELAAGTPGLIAAVGATTVLAAIAYWRSTSDDHGITTEVALILTSLLGGGGAALAECRRRARRADGTGPVGSQPLA